jgi:hypothetical protein
VRAWDTWVVDGHGHGNGGCDIMMSVAWGGHWRDRSNGREGGREANRWEKRDKVGWLVT